MGPVVNRSPRREADAARSYSIDDAARRQAQAERKSLEARRAELEAQGRIDHDCRFARFRLDHECRNRDGQPLRPYSACWQESVAQVRDQAAAEAAQAADALGMSDLCRPALPVGGPEYRMVQP